MEDVEGKRDWVEVDEDLGAFLAGRARPLASYGFCEDAVCTED